MFSSTSSVYKTGDEFFQGGTYPMFLKTVLFLNHARFFQRIFSVIDFLEYFQKSAVLWKINSRTFKNSLIPLYNLKMMVGLVFDCGRDFMILLDISVRLWIKSLEKRSYWQVSNSNLFLLNSNSNLFLLWLFLFFQFLILLHVFIHNLHLHFHFSLFHLLCLFLLTSNIKNRLSRWHYS